ncbi:MAG: hypothetical protein EOM59_07175 [Clostridia bacterium]|nr:hypothetical protein [Clostridia bacterium]
MKNQRSKAFIMILIMTTSLLFTGCDTYDNFLAEFFQKGAKETVTVKVGVFEPLTGADAEAASEEIKGIELAHDIYSEVLGLPVELVYADNQSNVDAAVVAAQELVDKNVAIVLGSYKSVLSLAGSDVFKAAQIPAITITSTNPIITQTNEYYFRVSFIDAFQGNSAAKYVLEHLGLQCAVALKMEGDDYAAAMIEQFESKMDRTLESEECVRVVEYPKGTTDFLPYLKQIEATSTSAIFFPSEPIVADEVIYQAVSANYDFHWIGNESWKTLMQANVSPLRDSKVYLEGVSYISGFDQETTLSEMTPIFIDAYKQKYGRDQKPSDAAALGFDAYLLALHGITESGAFDQGALIANKLGSTFELPGATGYITLNAQGDPIKDVVIDQYIEGEAKAVFTAVPIWGQ